MNEEKSDIRKKIKTILENNKCNFAQWSETICHKIINSVEFTKATIILSYMALPDEVNLKTVNKQALLQDKKVYIPRIVPNSNLMDFYAFNQKNYHTGSFGIEEPDLFLEKFQIEKVIMESKVKNQSILVLVPGRAFTKDGKRIPINELMECTKEECEYNKDGKCWNSNYSYDCKHRPNKEENYNE